MAWELNEKSRKEWDAKLKRSVVDKHLLPYIAALETRNPDAWDRLVMLMLEFGDVAFIYGLSAVLALDPDAPERGVSGD